jgi:hypothetical protein
LWKLVLFLLQLALFASKLVETCIVCIELALFELKLAFFALKQDHPDAFGNSSGRKDPEAHLKFYSACIVRCIGPCHYYQGLKRR